MLISTNAALFFLSALPSLPTALVITASTQPGAITAFQPSTSTNDFAADITARDELHDNFAEEHPTAAKIVAGNRAQTTRRTKERQCKHTEHNEKIPNGDKAGDPKNIGLLRDEPAEAVKPRCHELHPTAFFPP